MEKQEDKFKKQRPMSASKKLVAQITSLARVISHFKHGWLPAGFKRAGYSLMIHSNHLRCSKARLQGWGL